MPYDTLRERVWQSIETVPEGEHVLLYWPRGERGIGGMECATVYRGDHLGAEEMTFWTHGGPNAGSDWEPAERELPSHWMPLPPAPGADDAL